MLSYEVPVYYGLLTKQQMDDQRYSTTISQDSFARESMSIWTGNSKEAWFDSALLNKRRRLLHCERHACHTALYPDAYYIIGVKYRPRHPAMDGQQVL